MKRLSFPSRLFGSVLILALIFGAGVKVGSNKERIRHELRTDTLHLHDTVWIDQPQLTREVYIPVPAEVDSAAVVRDYYTQRIYTDTMQVTEVATVIVRDTVAQNTLTGRTFDFDIRIPKILPRDNAFGIGLLTGYGTTTVNAAYRYRNWQFTAGYDLRRKQPVFEIRYELFHW